MIGFTAVGCSSQHRESPYDNSYGYEGEYEYDEPGADVGMFAELSVYGRWHRLHAHGWVWQPRVGGSWRPYTRGHWAWTDYGWMWVAYEPFGWATYHYGYWTYEPRMGWLWIPGYDWAPCRVEWAVFDDYVCWAPLAPPGVHIGNPWRPGRVNVWIVVDGIRFTEPNVGRYRLATTKYKSRYRGDRVVYEAPRVRTIERFKGRDVPRVKVEIDRRKQDGREFTRIKLPTEQSRIVDRHRVNVPKVKGTPQRTTKTKKDAKQPPKKIKKQKDRGDSKGKSRGGRG
jgi:hypothetical protein